MPNKKINQLDVRTAVSTDLMLVGDPTSGTSYKSTLATLPLVPYTGATGAVNLGAYDLTVNGLTIGKGVAALSNNTALGYQSIYHATTGNYNTGVGYQSLHNITTGQYNTALGQSSMFTATSAAQNVAIGLNALLYTTSGSSNVVMGVDGLQHNTTGASNVALGYNAGSHITGGSTPNTTSGTSIYIGRDTKALANGQNNQIVIGYNAVGLGSNTTVIGNSSTTDSAIYGRLLVNYTSPVIGTYALDVNGSARVTSNLFLNLDTYITASDDFGSNRPRITFGTTGIFDKNWTFVPNTSGGIVVANAYQTITSTTAIFEIASNTRGFLPPRMTSAERTAITSPATGLLVYQTDGTEGLYEKTASAWRIINGGGGGGMAIGGAITSATAGSVLFAGASGVLAQDNANLFWDDTNNRLGIGTATPTRALDVASDILVNGVTIGKGNSSIISNVAFGKDALRVITTGAFNIGIGYETLYNATTTGGNVAIGFNALRAVTTTSGGNIGIGWQSLLANTASDNTGIGINSLLSNTSGTRNIAIGAYSFVSNLTGSNNTSIGYQALYKTTTDNNTGIGYLSLYNNSTGVNNSAIGSLSLYNNSTGVSNTAIGYGSMYYIASGNNNTAIGKDAGNFISGGSSQNTISNNSIYIGVDSRALASNQTNQIVIGYQSTGLGSNTTVIGNSSTTDAAIYGRLLVNYTSPVIGTYALDVNGTARVTGDTLISGVLVETITTNRQTSSYTFVLADRGKLVEMNVAAANNLSVPLNSNVAFPIGTKIDVTQYGAGQTTILATVGVTIRSFSSYVKLAGQYAACTLVKIGSDEWYLFGNLTA